MIHRHILFLLTILILVSPVLANTDIPPTNSGTGLNMIRRDNTQEQIQNRREIHDESKESSQLKRQSRREAFQLKLQEIKDNRKRAIVEKSDSVFIKINKRRTSNWLHVLDTFKDILTRVENRSPEAGIDISIEVANARTKIDAAETAVNNQATNDYTFDIQDEDTLKDVVSTAKETLKTDLKSTHLTVQAAKEAVRAAIQAVN